MAKVVVFFKTKMHAKTAEALIVDDEMRIKDFGAFCTERLNVKRIHVISIKPATKHELHAIPHLLDS